LIDKCISTEPNLQVANCEMLGQHSFLHKEMWQRNEPLKFGNSVFD